MSANGQTGRLLAVTTDASGHAAVQFKLGSWAGAGNNQVVAMVSGFVGEARFSASALAAGPNNIVVDSGNLQFGAVGQPLPKPFIVVVIDHGSNRLGGVPVTFTVKEGGGNFGGQTETTVTTDSDGRAAAVLTLGPDEGFDNNLVEANFSNNPGFAASFTASGKTVGKPEDTTISGVVLDNSNNPIAGVTLHVEGTSLTTQSDEQGQFVLQPAPVGHVKLLADGGTAPQRDGKPWPKLEYELVTIVEKSHGYVDNMGWAFQVFSDGRGIGAIGGGSGFPTVTGTTDLLDGNFHHVAATWSGGQMRFYVDAVLQGSRAMAAPANNNRAVNIGFTWGGGARTRFFKGVVDEAEVYNRALSAEEIQAIFDAGEVGKCKP